VRSFEEKLSFLARQLPKWEGSGILYCATRENTEIVRDYLREQGLDVVSYHAGYESDRKRALQEAFLAGHRKAIIATNALGMGIDKPDVRFIVHVDVPGSITAYYQEVGRAGRDGKPAEGVLLFDPRDSRIQEHFIRSAQPERPDFEAVLRALARDADGIGPSLGAVKARSGLHPTKVNVILAELTEQGLAEKKLVGRRQVYQRTGSTRALDLARYERQQQVRTRELEAMLRYGREEVPCLMHALRLALGDEYSVPCGHCGVCQKRRDPVQDDSHTRGAREWISRRSVPIPASARPLMTEGLALLDSERRTPVFVEFMRHRASSHHADLPAELLALLRRKLHTLGAGRRFAAVLVLPSRTWEQRASAARLVAQEVGAELFAALLAWREVPGSRQGDLLNNDQRRENVHGKMTLAEPVPFARNAAVLLLDDYVGSANSLKEAVRALRVEGGCKGEILPLALARIRWRVGAPGML
jgi:ATP-dependent DNA helicase RecQ